MAISIGGLLWNWWPAATGVLLAIGVCSQPILAESADVPDATVPAMEQVSPDPVPAPVQIPGGSATTVSSARVTGTVTYRERIALPPNAVVQVTLQDISRADASAVVLGEQTITTMGRQVPIPFEIAYDPSAIDERLTYSVRARITVDGQLLFTSTTATLVITRGRPTDVEIVLARV